MTRSTVFWVMRSISSFRLETYRLLFAEPTTINPESSIKPGKWMHPNSNNTYFAYNRAYLVKYRYCSRQQTAQQWRDSDRWLSIYRRQHSTNIVDFQLQNPIRTPRYPFADNVGNAKLINPDTADISCATWIYNRLDHIKCTVKLP
jgi:hypothetical protein